MVCFQTAYRRHCRIPSRRLNSSGHKNGRGCGRGEAVLLMIDVGPIDPSPLGDGFDESAFPSAETAGNIIAVPGDQLDTSGRSGLIMGHGTRQQGDKLMASLCGTVERANAYVRVRAVRGRFKADGGEVVVGRVTEIQGGRWIVDIDGVQEAVLMLASVGKGDQRRQTAADELIMRATFQEGDLLSAEVHMQKGHGGINLQVRKKFGKLREGQSISVPHTLVKRLTEHVTEIPGLGVDTVLGVNGVLWFGPKRAAGDETPATKEEREMVARCSVAARALAKCGVTISPASIKAVVNAAVDSGLQAKHMLSPRFLAHVLELEARNQERDRGAASQGKP